MAKVKANKNKAKDVESVKMKLGIKDRFDIINHLLPKQGNIIDLTITKDIRDKINFDQAELKKLGIKARKEGGYEWFKESAKIVSFTNAEIELLRTKVTELDNQKAIPADMLELCLMIRE